MDRATDKWQELFSRYGEWIRNYCVEAAAVVAPTRDINGGEDLATATTVVTRIHDE
ncbi:hypothetical protein Ngar_c08030 [Candidatus Nitrososphaera gargensis Ga9.2]|uniref:Uncharacterized protein n=1 Tax=Nitrososphaera gargensis (strain Ga9.2) TaxID=1237085 RepID=K0IDJ9_NITGG|nr:hypothetical protein [Candidatus Nitrososphaera gargensis]AFU57745.1 hypothetical protein Ngar_c08030 [Candidatus Nitrososphaera gargensis Ga9.2]